MDQIEQSHIDGVDEMSIGEIVSILKQYKRFIMFSVLAAGVLVAIVIFFIMKPKWEATAVLQVGQVGQVGQGPKLIEPIGQVVARMEHESFEFAIFNQLNFDKNYERKEVEHLYRDSLKVTKPKDVDVIEFKVSSYSPELAKILVANSVRYIQKIHLNLMSASLSRIQSEVENTAKSILELKAETDYLKHQLESKHDWNSYNATLGAMVLQNKADQLRNLEQKKLELEELKLRDTFNTKIIGDVAVSEDPIFPMSNIFQKLMLIILGALFAMLGAVFLALIHNSIKNSD